MSDMEGVQTVEQARSEVIACGNPARAACAQRYFKTGRGEYGEGDVFVGVPVPELRKLVRTYRSLSLNDALRLLHDPVHEIRFVALLLMILKFQQGDAAQQARVVALYLKNTRFINNWDLVDVSAPSVVGGWLWGRDMALFNELAQSHLVWERRIAIVATLHFIRRNDFAATLHLAEVLLDDSEDLIHKAAGWMLREVGKRDQPALEAFLETHGGAMPRTMLRYAVERLPEALRLLYLRRSGAEKRKRAERERTD